MWALTIKQTNDEYDFFNKLELRCDNHGQLFTIADNILQVNDEVEINLKKCEPPACEDADGQRG